MTQPLGDCPECGSDEPFEQVHPAGSVSSDIQCPDSPGDCTEWSCVGCGAALFMGFVITGTDDGFAATARQTFRAA